MKLFKSEREKKEEKEFAESKREFGIFFKRVVGEFEKFREKLFKRADPPLQKTDAEWRFRIELFEWNRINFEMELHSKAITWSMYIFTNVANSSFSEFLQYEIIDLMKKRYAFLFSSRVERGEWICISPEQLVQSLKNMISELDYIYRMTNKEAEKIRQEENALAKESGEAYTLKLPKLLSEMPRDEEVEKRKKEN